MENNSSDIDTNSQKVNKGITLSPDIIVMIENYANDTRRSFSNTIEYLTLKGLESEKTMPQNAIQS